jgi:hypothetical protein
VKKRDLGLSWETVAQLGGPTFCAWLVLRPLGWRWRLDTVDVYPEDDEHDAFLLATYTHCAPWSRPAWTRAADLDQPELDGGDLERVPRSGIGHKLAAGAVLATVLAAALYLGTR